MISFKDFSNHELLKQTKIFALREREAELLVLRGLREIELRRLHLEMGYPSLERFLVEELGYHSSTAYRKVDAMRLIADMPEVEKAIQKGEMNVTALSQAQSFFKVQARKGKAWKVDAKFELLQSIKGQSKLETEKLLKSIDPELPSPDRVRAINETQTEIKFIADDLLLKKLQKVRELTSHTQADASYNALFHRMADLVLKAVDPEQKKPRNAYNSKIAQVVRVEVKEGSPLAAPTNESKTAEILSRKSFSEGNLENKLGETHNDAESEVTCNQVESSDAENSTTIQKKFKFPPVGKSITTKPKSRYIKTADRHFVWKEAQGECSYVDPVSHRKCTSRWKIQVEHRIPFAKNGTHHPENLTLLCAAHNRLAAIHSYGKSKMNPYLRVPVPE